MPPVARITATSRALINSCVPSSVTAFIHPMLPAGAPAPTAASAINSTVLVMHFVADGWGLMTMGQRAFSAMRTLYIAVEVGLVDGTIAATTPNGSAISTTLLSSRRAITPTVRIGRMNS